MNSKMSDTKPKQEFPGSAAKGKSLPDAEKTSMPGKEFGNSKKKKK